MFGIFKRTYNNLFITICRNNGEVILTNSVGSFRETKLRTKQRRNLISATTLSWNVARLLRSRKIRRLDVFFLDSLYKRHSPKRLAKLILQPLQANQITVGYFLSYKIKAHNGVMKKKKRR